MTKNIIAKNNNDVAEIFGKYIGKPMKYVSIESSETSQCVVDINVIVDNITLMGPYLRLTGKDLDYKDRYVEFFMYSDLMVSDYCIVSIGTDIDGNSTIRAFYPLNMVMHGNSIYGPDLVKAAKVTKKGE